MTELIIHRRNTNNLLSATDSQYGTEIDLRSYKNELILNHDPFKNGEGFENWIKNYKHGTLIINIKDNGIEDKVNFFLKKYAIKSYFFLDQSFPSLFRIATNGNQNIAVRVSDYESVETALSFSGLAKWVWIDTFRNFNLTKDNYYKLKNKKFKLCLASPELNPNNKTSIKDIKKITKERKIFFDAICTKFPKEWI